MQLKSSSNVVGTYGTVTHMPNEVLLESKISMAVDVYSFGVLLWELYTRCVVVYFYFQLVVGHHGCAQQATVCRYERNAGGCPKAVGQLCVGVS